MIPMLRIWSRFRIMSGMAFASSARMWVMEYLGGADLARRLRDALDLFLAPDRERRLIALRGEPDLVGETRMDRLGRLVRGLDRAARQVAEGDVQAAGGRRVDRPGDGDPAELEPGDLLARGGVLDRVDEELERVRFRVLRVELVERAADGRERLRLLAGELRPAR